MMYLSLCLFFFLLTARCVYIGGKTLNDHIVVVFVGICMLPYVGAGWYWEQPLFGLGVIGIYALFAVLVRKREAQQWMVPFVILSQPSYSIAFWSYFCLPLQILILWLVSNTWSVSLSMCILPVAMGGWGCLWTWLRNEHHSVHQLGNRGIRLVQLSDIHASPVMRGQELDALMDKVNALQPDVVCLTGDLVMPFSEEDHEYMRSSLSRLRAPLYCCMGNHDLPIQQTLVQELENDHHHMLIDQRLLLSIREQKVEITGLQFHWKNAEQKTLPVLSSSASDPEAYRIVLAHDPRYFRWIRKEHCDLVLSGHTHGGQLALNMFGIAWSPLRLLGFYDQGFFHKEGCSLYVHKGNWIWGLPPRMGVASEIALFIL